MKGEYEKVFSPNLLDEENRYQLIERCCQLLIASMVLDKIRDLIPQYTEEYAKRLPIIRKSAYYLAGYTYAYRKTEFDKLCTEMKNDYDKNNDNLLRGKNYPERIGTIVKESFVEVLDGFEKFYKSVRGVEKADIDNLLKDIDFEKAYLAKIDQLISTE